ncbi:MAG: peptidoglycan-binding protein [Actinomycetota bacterium]|nr:peptidoglycan-binding protein [Actinomycetota bacterium]
MRDLQRRLGAAGFPPATGAEAGCFCASTQAAVLAFQTARGLRGDGVCDENTWTALVEASWKFGDRSLFLTSPNLRGDDVAELQSRLARLGFDCGRVDGILGPRTAKALEDFQSNCGVTADAVCGGETVKAIVRVSGQTGTGPGVATVRERERLRRGLGSLANCKVVLGQFGGLSALTRSLARELRHRGATVMPLDEPDAVAQAIAANHFGADVYLGFESHAEATCVAHFYQVPSFESVGGRTLAELLAHELAGELCEAFGDASSAGAAAGVRGPVPSVQGMRLPVLRETRMPAVVLAVGPVRVATDASPQLAAAVLRALELWILRAG